MRSAHSGSWQFGHGVSQGPNALLYVRDALRLPVAAAPDIPPPLNGEVPDESDLIDIPLRVQAAEEWSGWWRTALGAQFRHSVGDIADPQAVPDDAAIRAGTRTLSSDAYAWPDQPRRKLRPERDLSYGMFAWTVTRDAVTRTAIEAGVPVGALSGSASVLLVEGIWWHLASPGFAVCSVDAALDATAATAILREVFLSGLAG